MGVKGEHNRKRRLTALEKTIWYWQAPPDDVPGRLSWLLSRWRLDPIAFSVEYFRIILQPYQAQILLDLADAPLELFDFYGCDPGYPARQVLVPSGHGLGKTRLMAVAIWWHLITQMFSKTLVTAPTSDQLTGQLWGELRKLHRRAKKSWPQLADEWDILSSSITHRNPDYGDWMVLARTSRPEKPEALQGAHALDDDDEFGQLARLFGEQHETTRTGGILVCIEEASGVDDSTREVLEGALSEEGARLLAPGNPTRPDGWFAESLDNRERYAVHPLDCRLSDRTKTYTLPYRDFGGQVHTLSIRGFVRPAYWQDIIAECDGDEDADRVRVRVRGLAPRSAIEQCIKTHWVEAAMNRSPDRDSAGEPGIVSLDFGLSADKHGMGVRRGWNILDASEWLPKDKPDEITLDAAQRAIDAVESYHCRIVIGDSNGVGKGAMEYLTKYFAERPEKGVRVIHFNAGQGAIDPKRYYRRRDEMWFKSGRAFFSDPRASLPNVPGLKTQLCAAGYAEDATRRIRVESKEDIKKRTGQPSGNMADAVLQSLLPHVYAEKSRAERPPEHPKVFLEHFKRWKAKRFGLEGALIR